MEITLTDLKPDPKNARRHPERNLQMIQKSLQEVGAARSIVIDEDNVILAGNGVIAAAEAAGIRRVHVIEAGGEEIIAVRRTGLTDEQKVKLALYDNRTAELAEWNAEQLVADLDAGLDLGNMWQDYELQELLKGVADGVLADDNEQEPRSTLAERFIVPPFSVLDARQGYWQERKRAWIALGIESELGRGGATEPIEHTGNYTKDRIAREAACNITGAPPLPEWAQANNRVANMAPGGSIFDPVLCELAYTWFCPPDGKVLDPFAGGSVRGIVAAKLGRRYTGIDLSAEQIAANEVQAKEILGPGRNEIYDANAVTPIEKHGNIWFKRDDYFTSGGVRGGKVRTCIALAQGAAGLTTAGSRSSPQVNIVAHVAKAMGIPCQVHTPTGELSPEVLAAQGAGAEVVQHKAGYNNVIIKRAKDAAAEYGWTNIPFGMECQEAVEQTRKQVKDIPPDVQRIVAPVGSGMSLSGLLWGLRDGGLDIPVVGVCVGADPRKRLNKYAPPDWAKRVELIEPTGDYAKPVTDVEIEGVRVDSGYEAKCLPYLQDGDLFWIVGIRQTEDANVPKWIVGNSLEIATLAPGEYDFIFSCPPYYDLEIYSDAEGGLSNLTEYADFLACYRQIIASSVAMLKDNRFACFVVGDIRDKKGLYRNFVSDTIAAFQDAGAMLYNEAILVTAVGSLPIRVSSQFPKGRKLGKTHQNVLVFVKGDWREVVGALGDVGIGFET